MRYIIAPMLFSTIKVSLTFTIADNMKLFDQLYITTKGGPGMSSCTLPLYVYRQAFDNMYMGYACTLAVGSILLSLVLIGAANFLLRGRREISAYD